MTERKKQYAAGGLTGDAHSIHYYIKRLFLQLLFTNRNADSIIVVVMRQYMVELRYRESKTEGENDV